jgi:lipoprotein-releasing system ATP-binding protein
MGISVRNLWKSIGEPPTKIIKGISLDIKDGEFVALTGRSGSGKSTLLYLISSLDNPTEGEIEISGHNLKSIKTDDLCNFRTQKIGFVFQFHYLISELTALENVLLPAMRNKQQEKVIERAKWLLEKFGLEDKMKRLPRQLSGGEQQRVAIARALSMSPEYLFADEPTGALDSVNGELVMNIIKEANKENKTTVIMVTHDPDFAKVAHRQIYLADGIVVQDERQ